MSGNSSDTTGNVSTENIFGNIFTACDPDSTGYVQPSKIVEYIKPYLKEKISKLWELKNALDPKDEDAEVDASTFYSVMSDWTTKFGVEGEHLSDDSFRHDISSDVDNMVPFKQSTPRQSLGNRIRTGHAETELMTSSPGYNTIGFQDKSLMEDQINELNHQNKKYFDEVFSLKTQLESMEGHNELLQSELEKTKRRLTMEHEMCEGYLRRLKDFEDIREDLLLTEEDNLKLKKNLSALEKDNNALREKNNELENEKLHMQECLNLKQKKLNEINLRNDILQEELEAKNKEVLKLEDVNIKLEVNLQDRDTDIQQYREHIENLKQEKEQCKKYLARYSEENSARHYQTLSKYNQLETTKADLRFTPSVSTCVTATTTTTTINTSPKTTSHTPSFPNEITTPTKSLTQSPKPFDSPIQTNNFRFYDEDSPIARSSKVGNLGGMSKVQKVLFFNPKDKPEKSSLVLSNTPIVSTVLKGDESINKSSSIEIPSNDSIDIEDSMNLLARSPHNDLHTEMAEVDEKYRTTCDSTTVLTTASCSSLEILEPKLLKELKELKQKLVETEITCDKLLNENCELKENLVEKSLLEDQLEETRKENEVIRMKLLNLFFKDRNDMVSISNILEAGIEDREDIKSQWEELRVKGIEAEKITQEVCEMKENLEEQLLSNFESSLKSKELLRSLEKRQEITNQRINDLEQKNAVYIDLIDSLKVENSRLINDNETLQLLKTEIEDMHNQCEAEIFNHAKYMELQAELERVKTGYTENIKALQATILSLEQDKMRLEDELLDSLKEFINDSSKQCSEIENKLNESSRNLDKLSENSNLHSVHILKLEEGLIDSLKSVIQTFDVEKGELNRTIETLISEKDLLNKRIQALQFKQETCNNEELATLNNDKQELLEKINLLQLENEELIENSRKNQDLALNNEKCKLLEKINDLCVEIDLLSQKLSQTEENLRVRNENNHELLIKLKELQSENEDLLRNSFKKDVNNNSTQTDDVKVNYTPKFNRLKVQIQRAESKNEYLETQLEMERMDKLRTHEKLLELRKALDVEQERLLQEHAGKILEIQQKIRCALKQFCRENRPQLENLSGICDVLKAMDGRVDYFNFGLGLNKSIELLEEEVGLCCNLIKELEEVYEWRKNKESSPKQFTLKPPTLIYRPVSPDSPNLEYLIEKIQSSDITDESFVRPDSAGAGDNNYESDSEEATLTGLNEQDKNESIYDDAINVSFPLFENLSSLYEELVEGACTNEKIEEKFTALVLEFTLDKSTIQKRLKTKLAELNRLEIQASDIVRELKQECKDAGVKEKLENLFTLLCQITRFAKQYGALEQEEKYINSSNVIINYAAVLRKKLDLTVQTLHKSTNTLDENQSEESTGSNSRVFKSIKVLFCMAAVFITCYVFFFESFTSCSRPGRGFFADSRWINALHPFVRVEYRVPPS